MIVAVRMILYNLNDRCSAVIYRKILYKWFLQCGASILNEGVVLTAAHCVKGLGIFIVILI